MGNTIEQNIKVKEIFDVSEALKGIKQIQDALSKLALDPNTKTSFNKLFDNMERQAEKASAAAASGFKNKGDVTAYTRAMDQIVDSYDRIINKIEVLKADGSITLDIDTTEFKQVNARINELKKNLDDLGDKMSKSLSTIDKIEGRRGANGTIKSVGSWQTAIEEFKNGNIQKATAALRVLKGLMTKASNNGVDFEKDKTWKAYKKDYEELSKAINDYNTANQQYKQDSSELAAKDQRRQEILEDTNKLLEQTEELTKKSGQGAREYAIETEKAANDTQKLNSELEHFKSKAAYFFGISNAINLFKRAVRSAYDTVKDLDAVMTETAVVTNFSVGDMWSQLPEYTQRANELGVTIHDTYEAATLFYQQGLKTNEVMQISNETLKMARIAGLDAATASDRMTNALRGFNMELDKTSAQRVNDVYSKLAAITASNTDEISTAMTKVASLAHNANMEFETTAAFLAQIIESTRESAETAGTALKTVVARFSEVKKLYSRGELLGQDEEGEEIDVNKVSTALRSAGINLNEYLTGAKGLDDIFIELAEKWDSLDQVQQRYIATMAAGSRQQSRFIALMSDYKRTVQLVEAANNANGASQQQYEKTLESLQTKLARLKNAWNEFILGLANSDAIKGAVDLLTSLITAINNLIKLVSNGNAGIKMVTTFFTAFTAFKVGKSLIGKNSVVTNFFARLVGDSTIVAKGSASQIATSFYSQLADKIANPTKNTKGNIATDLYNYFNPAKTAHIAGLTMDKDDVLTNLVNKFDSNVSNDTIKNFREEVGSGLEAGTLTTEQLNTALEKAGQSFRVTGKNAEECGLILENNNGVIDNNVTNLKRLSAAAMAVGGIMIAVGDRLEELEGPAQTFGSIIKGLGAGLMVFGTIMSVYLPLQAQLMAKEVTSAIVSIPIVGWIAGIISAIVALGVAIYSFAKNNSAEEKLKHSTEVAKGAADAANEAREAYEKLNEAFNNLDDKNKAIEEATRGTQEWRDAIKEVNAAVLELMNNYDGIELTRDENGALSITASSKKEVEDRIAEEKARAEVYERVSKIKDYENEINTRESNLQYTRSGGRMGVAHGDPADELLLKYKDNLEELANMDPKDIINLLKGTDIAAEKMNYDYDEGLKKVLNYIDQYDKNMTAIQSEKTALGATFLENANIDDDLKKYANVLLTNDYVDNLINNNKEKYKQDNKGTLQDKVADLFDMTWEQLIDKMPDFKEYQEEDLRYYLASEDALKEVNIQLKAFTGNINNLSDAEKALAASPEGGALTRDQIRELQNKSRWGDYFKDFGGEAVFGSQENFNEWLDGILKSAIDSFDTKQYGEEFNNLLDDIFYYTKDLDLSTYKTFADNLYSVYATSGVEGVNKVKHSLTKMMNSLEPDEIEDFIKGINNINWASASSFKELDALAEEFGISEEAMESFKNQVIELGNASANIDLEKLGSVLGLIKKIQSGEQGRSFTEEDYNNLISHGVDAGDFQYNIATGNYDYIGESLNDITSSVEKYFKTATSQLEKEMASNKAIETLQNNGALPTNESDINQIKNFLTGYNYIAGKNSLVSADFLQSATEEQIFAKYDEIMNAFARRDDTQATLDQAYAYNYQTYSGAENAAGFEQGDEIAGDTLKQKIINSGLPQAFIDSLYEEMESGEATNAGNVVDTITAAKAYGIDVETLNEYVTTLQEIEGLEDTQLSILYELALANEMYQDGFKKVTDTYEEWIELKREDGSIQPPDDGNRELLKTYNQLTKDLGEMYSVSESVTNEFLNMPEAAELLEGVIENEVGAAAKLREELAKIQLIQLGIDSESEFGSQIFGLIDDIMEQAGTLEFGATLNASPAMQSLADLLQAAGYTSEQMQEIFNAFGWSPDMDTEKVPVDSVIASNTTGYQEIVHPDGSKEVVPIDGVTEFAEDGYITVPVIGNATFTPPEMPSYTPKTISSGGGGGGGSEKKPSYWKNPYDELYNLQEKINEALRTREDLERRYQKLLKQEQATLRDIRKAYYDQIAHLSSEADLQKQMAEGRLRQIKQIGEQMYTDSEGDRTSFSDLGVTKYASYNEKTGLIQIDWSGLEAIANDSDRTEEGKAAEAYISKLEELVSSYEEVRDKLWEIEDKIEEIRQAAIDSYLSFEDRVMDAVVDSYQRQIDSYQDMSETLEKANTEIIDSIHEQIDLSRQIRDNTKKEQDIADMENRLAYLQRDTSGGNDLEILKLQKDIDKAREDYTDTLIDQAINDMQKDAERAAEQRSKQIDIMNVQLKLWQDNGTLWKETHDLINGAIGKDGKLDYESKLIKYLKDTEAYKTLSAIGKEKWMEEVAEAFHKAWVGKDEAEDKYDVDANDDEIVNHSGTSDALEHVTGTETSTTREDPFGPYGRHKFDEATEAGVAMNICGPNQGWGNGKERFSKLEEKGLDAGAVQSIVNDIVNSGWDDSYYRKKYDIDDLSDYSYYAFKSGGLADFTGPAWLDGTKTKPEIILSAQDSANFIALRDILASLLNVQGGLNNNQKGGDNYFDIDISANIDSDYDVDKLAERIKKGIYEDGQYRNVNTINYLR